jgi:uncharacterized protein
MTMNVMKIATMTSLMFSGSMAMAEPLVLTVGSGGEKGTYYPVIAEIAEVCNSSTLTIQHRLGADGVSIGGSDNNLRGILRNEIPAGIIQLDSAYLQLQTNPDMPRVQALLPLHEEAVHVIVPTYVSVLVKEAVDGWMNDTPAEYENRPNDVEDIADLKGHVVVSWGGSMTTTKILSQLGGLDLEIIEVKNEAEALEVVRNGGASAIVATVGYPAAWIEALPDEEFTLLKATGIVKDVEAVYGLSGVSYDNLGTSGQAIEALAVDAILFTRKFDKPEMVSALAELQACVRENISEFRDTLGTHPAWQRIDPAREMKWSNLFIAPASTATTVAGDNN